MAGYGGLAAICAQLGRAALGWKHSTRIYGLPVVSDLEVQHRLRAIGGAMFHLSDALAFCDEVALFHEQSAVVPVHGQVIFVVFDDDEPAVAPQAAPAIYDFAGCTRKHQCAPAAGDSN